MSGIEADFETRHVARRDRSAMNGDIRGAAEALRQRAEAGPIGKRHSSFELYALLADCMALAERVAADEKEFNELRMSMTLRGVDGGPRRYVERDSDEYILVCRYVFSDGNASKERSNASRYAHALREAARQQINSRTLNEHLRTKGGVNALFLRRPLAARMSTTKTLYLDRQISIRKGEPFSLRLLRNADGSFAVLEHSE